MNYKIILSLFIIVLSCAALLILSSQALILCVSLILLALIKNRYFPIKKELSWYLLVAMGSASIEIVLVNFGNAWGYSDQHLFNIPIWMPFFWANLGISIIVLYDGINEKGKQ